mmetsp:Transcript_29890/g.54758  ORF Transcript_29890/g.54758 Transcript_29890/m.54758 type:complete len:205 (+) Transcript_29890:3076-3690(+)
MSSSVKSHKGASSSSNSSSPPVHSNSSYSSVSSLPSEGDNCSLAFTSSFVSCTFLVFSFSVCSSRDGIPESNDALGFVNPAPVENPPPPVCHGMAAASSVVSIEQAGSASGSRSGRPSDAHIPTSSSSSFCEGVSFDDSLSFDGTTSAAIFFLPQVESGQDSSRSTAKDRKNAVWRSSCNIEYSWESLAFSNCSTSHVESSIAP